MTKEGAFSDFQTFVVKHPARASRLFNRAFKCLDRSDWNPREAYWLGVQLCPPRDRDRLFVAIDILYSLCRWHSSSRHSDDMNWHTFLDQYVKSC